MYDECLRELCLLSHKKKRPRGHLTAAHSYLVGGYRGDGSNIFLEVHGDRVGGKRHQPEHT